jgi:uncharacterized protein
MLPVRGLGFNILLGAALLAGAIPGASAAGVAVPELKARVTDLTGTLSSGEQSQLESALAAFESRKGSQVAVLLVPTTQPETIEQYGIRVAEAWKLGRKKVDDGALLLIAKDDHTVRIEVGYGLEGILPDAIAKRIIEEDIVPRFKQGDFAGGVRAGANRIMRVIDGEPLPAPVHRSSGFKGFDKLFPVLFFAIPIGGGLLRLLLGRLLAGLIGAGGAGGIAWFLGAPLPVLGFVAFFVFLFIALGGGGRGVRSSSGWSGGGGWSSGGGGGGFSGGGGSFGGGGASGRW